MMEEINLKTKDVDANGKFFFKNKRVLLTYGTRQGEFWPDKKEFITWFTKICKQAPLFIRCAHETGGKKIPYKHMHVLVDFGKALQTTNARYFDYTDDKGGCGIIHPHIRVINNESQMAKAKSYIAKEDPENDDLNEKFLERIWNYDNKSDMLVNEVQSPTMVPGLLAAWEARPHFKIIEDIKLKFWQYEVKEILLGPRRPRKILWIYDPEGGKGKTTLIRHLMIHNREQVFATSAITSTRDMATIIKGAIDGGWDGTAFVMNLARSEADWKVYSCIEMVADGLVTTTKYQGGTVIFNQPIMCVMANRLPDWGKMSIDRWDVRRIFGDPARFDDDQWLEPIPAPGSIEHMINRDILDNGEKLPYTPESM